MTARENPQHDDGLESPADDDAAAVEGSRDELVAEADQFLDLSGADPETHGADPGTHGAAPVDR